MNFIYFTEFCFYSVVYSIQLCAQVQQNLQQAMLKAAGVGVGSMHTLTALPGPVLEQDQLHAGTYSSTRELSVVPRLVLQLPVLLGADLGVLRRHEDA